MRSLRLVPYWSVHETLGVDAHNAPLKMRTRRIHLSRAGAWSCVRRHPVAGAALGSTDVEGSDPPARGPGTGAGPGVFSHAGPRPPGVAPDQRSFQEGCSAPLRGGGSPVLPTVQPVCLRYRRGPGADPRRTPDRGLPGTSSHESAFRIPGDVGMWESPGSRVPGSISSPVLSRSR